MIGRSLLIGPLLVVACFPQHPSAGAEDGSALRLDRDAALKVIGTGSIVGSGGDVNGDGFGDAVFADAMASPRGRRNAGSVHVVFGRSGKAKVDVEALSDGGFRIDGGSEEAYLSNPTIIGDVNGDGLDEVLAGALGADNNGRADSGSAYVIFGKRSTTRVDLRAFDEGRQGETGYRVDGASSASLTGDYVASLGELNGDGKGDMAIAAPFAGRTYVVFGKSTTEPVDLLSFELNTQGTAGWRIDTPVPDRNSGYAIGGAGDVNADGTPDVIVGVIPEVFDSPGDAYVVFGKVTPDPVDVRNMAVQGFRIQGRHDSDETGQMVAGAGDVNGDGLSDVLVGVPRHNRNIRGLVYVAFGKTDGETVRLDDFSGAGFVVRAKHRFDRFGESGVGAGDLNGDGLSDFLVGAWAYDPPRRSGAGATWLIYGNSSIERIDLGRLGPGGYRIDGARRLDESGGAIAVLDDLNGDDLPEFLIGTFRTDPRKAYVVWGRSHVP